MEQRIVGFHQDQERHWVAELECGHHQHVRHDPPWTSRPWVTTEAGRHKILGQTLACRKCDQGAPRDGRPDNLNATPLLRREPMPVVIVRQAVLSDLPDLVPLFDGYRQFYGQAPDLPAAERFLRDRFNHGESVLFLAQAELGPVGFTQLYPSFSSVSLARTFVLNDLFVVAGHRRTGAGSELLRAAVAHARALGAVRMTLSTDIGNEVAQSTYEAGGWRRDSEYVVYHFSPQS